ncbi:MAG: Ig-like domain-containing protein, partial [Bacteroidaceae bacterium]|nr:Ig-like domain-containing protein [Bacteroidaceae bacterium]
MIWTGNEQLILDIMRKFYKFLPFTLLLLAGCSSEDLSPNKEVVETSKAMSYNVFTAEIKDSPLTRAIFDTEKSLVWQEGDQIGVLSDLEGVQTFTSLNAGKTATLEGETITGNQFYAFYPRWSPAQGVDENDPTKLNVYVDPTTYYPYGYNLVNPSPDEPHVQYGDGRRVLMVAKSNDQHFSFKQTMALVKFSLKGNCKVNSVQFESNNYESLSGFGTVDLTADEPILVIDDGYVPVIRINENFQQLSEDETMDLYFRIPPTKFEKGFNLRIYGTTSDGMKFSKLKSYDKSVSFERAELYRFSAMDVHVDIRAALKAFYDATGGDNWTNNANWNSDAPYNQWYGLSFDMNGYLSEINLDDNNLTGSIPDEIAWIPTLDKISVNNNHLTSLGNGIGELTSMRYFYAENNELSEFPTALLNCHNIWYLGLSDNQIEGTPPVELFTAFPNICSASFSGNKLSGVVPSEVKDSPRMDDFWMYVLQDQQDGYGLGFEWQIVPVESVSLNYTEDQNVNVGEQLQFIATPTPSNASLDEFKWTVSDASVGSIDENGLFTALSPGTTTVYFVRNNGGVWAAVDVTVMDSGQVTEEIPVETITFNYTKEMKVKLGDHLTF